jgi:Asp-tRNA(Asn)/Glu-tRNA(Gln) amidotransferase C subunit
MLTQNTLEKIKRLTHLKTVENLNLNQIDEFLTIINKIDVNHHIAEVLPPIDLENMRCDNLISHIDRNIALKNANKTNNEGFIIVHKVINAE